MKIIKDCLIKEDFEKIVNTIYSPYFSWYRNNGVNFENDGFTQFTHFFYSDFTINSDNFNILNPLIKIINPLSLIRIKVNLITKTEKIIEHGYHYDDIYKTSNAILYINTCNGYTKFENGEIVKSEENKLLIFDNNLKHTGSSCTDKNERILININFIKKTLLNNDS